MAMEEEFWKPIPGFDFRYRVSSLGRVSRGRRLLTGHVSPKGYHRVNILSESGRARNVGIHTLVCAAFIGPRPAGHVVAHHNGVKSDNRRVNLSYCTRAELLYFAEELGLQFIPFPKGERNPQCRLTPEQVRSIRSERASGDTLETLSARYHVTRKTVGEIARRKTWGHLE